MEQLTTQVPGGQSGHQRWPVYSETEAASVTLESHIGGTNLEPQHSGSLGEEMIGLEPDWAVWGDWDF